MYIKNNKTLNLSKLMILFHQKLTKPFNFVGKYDEIINEEKILFIVQANNTNYTHWFFILTFFLILDKTKFVVFN